MAAIAALIVLLGILAWLVISGSGLLPGDTGVAPVADPAEGQGSQTMNLAAWPWTIVVAVTTLVLGIGIAYGQLRTRRLSRTEFERGETASRELYREDEDARRPGD
ncbi:MAG: hypothetical protein EOP21_08950 [Hyphomicrobiales bacterium]|nr:MAG: hypothetical protein EOP21_08950 [Hyphomicrobiales bacterium]